MKEQNNDLFSKLGIDIDSDKINIDIGKTKDFFNSLQSTLQDKADTIQKDISEGKVDMAENVGIKIDKDNINIDLEKTRSFMEDFAKKIEGFMDEIDKAVKNIDTKLSDKK